ncbi:hypothetical protein BVG79_01246 [Ketogulonicigenium robustum]|uniref:Uncharacterized protein n=1 Tax=Ketogulonicigenium robustum TaxID=92947 RepID=A0A1W6NZB2_9RHOB|nr:hypothetical protein [Ketogulonicigenium robustum]ARO14592.1 hypothetical protein BVG79_01246 [Ketogulonicigenium robustum]
MQGDLGTSLYSKPPVVKELSTRFPNTLKLALVSHALAVVLGIGALLMAVIVFSPR